MQSWIVYAKQTLLQMFQRTKAFKNKSIIYFDQKKHTANSPYSSHPVINGVDRSTC